MTAAMQVSSSRAAGSPARDTKGLKWRKSSLSYAHGNCVEVARMSAGSVLVRDSKNLKGPVLQFTPAEWDAFIGGVRNREFGRPPGHAA